MDTVLALLLRSEAPSDLKVKTEDIIAKQYPNSPIFRCGGSHVFENSKCECRYRREGVSRAEMVVFWGLGRESDATMN